MYTEKTVSIIAEGLKLEGTENTETTKLPLSEEEIFRLERKYNVPEEKTGFERLRRVFTVDANNEGITTELYEMILLPMAGFIGGAIYGGLPAARHARGRYIAVSNTEIYEHRVEAVRSAQNAGSRGFIRYGFRWGWRTAVLAGTFHFLSTSLSIYRNKEDLANYAFASVTMGGIYRFNLGLKGLVGGAFAGSLIGIPAGLFMLGVCALRGETNLQRYRLKRLELAKERWQELEMRRTMTPLMLDYMEEELKKKNLIKRDETEL